MSGDFSYLSRCSKQSAETGRTTALPPHLLLEKIKDPGCGTLIILGGDVSYRHCPERIDMRVTQHYGRADQNGVYTTRHNDRNFDTGHADHIDKDRLSENVYYYAGQKTHLGLTFDQVEAMVYENHFRPYLDERNARQIASRHPSRVLTMDKFRGQKQTCPEEVIMQIGDKSDHPDSKTLRKIFAAFNAWHEKTFPQVKVLDIAFHNDEATPHLHLRRVWIAHDKKTGLEYPNQNGALQEMNVSRPDPEKPESRYNNAKITYTALCRNKFIELCQEQGLDIEIEPKERSESGLSLAEYQTRQEEKKAAELSNEIQGLEEQKSALTDEVRELTDKRDKLIINADNIQERLDAAKAEHDRLQEENEILRSDNSSLQDNNKRLQDENRHLQEDRKGLLSARSDLIKVMKQYHQIPLRYDMDVQQRKKIATMQAKEEPSIWVPRSVAKEIASKIPESERSDQMKQIFGQYDALNLIDKTREYSKPVK